MLGSTYFGQAYFAQGYPAVTAGVPEWVLPANHATGQIGITPLVFIIPEAANALHFEVQLDTANTFSTGNLQVYKSWLDQTGWQYWDGAGWQPFPNNGVPQDYIGNQARYIPNLTTGTWYRRIRVRIKS